MQFISQINEDQNTVNTVVFYLTMIFSLTTLLVRFKYVIEVELTFWFPISPSKYFGFTNRKQLFRKAREFKTNFSQNHKMSSDNFQTEKYIIIL